jgi:hypothetical protein
VGLRRRILLDMHVPDWDPQFLTKHDPRRYTEVFAAAGAEEITFYAQSHLGLCNWPTRTGKHHANLNGRDLVAEAIDAIHAAGLRARAYYSVVHNNWAYENHRDWRTTVPLRTDGGYPGPHYGLVCPNNPSYRQLVTDQLEELVSDYEFEALFVDLTFFTPVCQCGSCATRFREAGLGAPQPIADWTDSRWIRQRRAVESWAVEFAAELRDRVKRARPELSVQHNFTALCGPTFGVPLTAIHTVDLPAADFYGDLEEQLAVGRIFRWLADGQPAEFMTSISRHVVDGVSIKTADEMAVTAGLAAVLSGGLTFIDAVAPDGTVSEPPFEHVAVALSLLTEQAADSELRPVADIAVYYTDNSRMDPRDNGRPSAEITWGGLAYPHFAAVKAASGHLQRAGLPYDVVVPGVPLDRYAVVVLPDAICLSAAECAALTDYVLGGGHLYASGSTGRWLVEAPGEEAWALDELFGISRMPRDWYGDPEAPGRPLDGVTNFHTGKAAFLHPRTAALKEALRPAGWLRSTDPGFVRSTLRPSEATKVLASVDLAWGDRWGSVFEHTWSSVHNDPPWRQLIDAAVTQRPAGQGSVVYSLAAAETTPHGGSLFVALVRELLGNSAQYEVHAPHDVFAFIHGHPDGRLRVAVLDVTAASVARRRSIVDISMAGQYRLGSVVPGEAAAAARTEYGDGSTVVRLCLDRRMVSLWLIPETPEQE